MLVLIYTTKKPLGPSFVVQAAAFTVLRDRDSNNRCLNGLALEVVLKCPLWLAEFIKLVN